MLEILHTNLAEQDLFARANGPPSIYHQPRILGYNWGIADSDDVCHVLTSRLFYALIFTFVSSIYNTSSHKDIYQWNKNILALTGIYR